MHTVTCAYAYCEMVFEAQRSTARYCSSDCRVAAFHKRERERAAEERWADVGNWRYCLDPDCDYVIDTDERSDKLYCSNACRQRSYRNYGRGADLSADDLRELVGLVEALRVTTNAKTDPAAE